MHERFGDGDGDVNGNGQSGNGNGQSETSTSTDRERAGAGVGGQAGIPVQVWGGAGERPEFRRAVFREPPP